MLMRERREFRRRDLLESSLLTKLASLGISRSDVPAERLNFSFFESSRNELDST